MLFISATVSLTIGLFELWQVFSMGVLGDFSLLNSMSIFPSSFQTNGLEYILLCTFLTTAGLFRVLYAVSGETYLAWMLNIVAQIVGSVFLWNLALLPHFNINNLSLADLALEVIRGQHDLPSSVYLFAFPGTTVFFLLCGPGVKGKTVHWQDKDR